MRMVKLVWSCVGLCVGMGGSLGLAQATWEVEKTLHVGGEGSWDYVTVDEPTHRLFLPRQTHTLVVDALTGKVLGDIPGQKGAHGVAVVPALNRGFITDGGGTGAIVVFDLTTYAVLGTLPTVPDTDGIVYDKEQNLVLAVSGDEGVLMSFRPEIDPVNGKIAPGLALGGKPEFLATDGTGKAFINLEDKGLVAEVDLKARTVLARWPVAPGGQPVGMAIDRETHRLFIGCRKPQMLVAMSTDDGKIVGSVPIGPGVDATAFYKGQAFASSADGTLAVVDAADGKFELVQTVKTPVAARTMGLEAAKGVLYLPTAEFEAQAPGATGRRKMKPGTFMVVIVMR